SRRSRQISRRFPSFSKQLVTNTRSPQTTGDEWPIPGMGVFQRTFSSLPHFSGTFVSADVPSPRGPRQPGHSSADSGIAQKVQRKGSSADRTVIGQLRGFVFRPRGENASRRENAGFLSP